MIIYIYILTRSLCWRIVLPLLDNLVARNIYAKTVLCAVSELE